MTITSKSNILTISGNIKSVTNVHSIEEEISILKKKFLNITIHLLDSISITSSLIGYLCKLINQENISISLHIHNNDL
ncbi:hypothetical protein [Sulfurimonas sp.]